MADAGPSFIIPTTLRFCSIFEPKANKNPESRSARPFYGAAIPLIDLPDEVQHFPDVKYRIEQARENSNDLYHIRSSFAPVLTLSRAKHPDCPDPDDEYRKLERAMAIMKLRRMPCDWLLEGMKAEIRVSLVTMDTAPAPYTGKQFLAIDEVTFNIEDMAKPYNVKAP